MSKRNNDGDVLTNRLNLGLAKSKNILASWMGAQEEPTASSSKPKDEREDEDLKQDFFNHDRLGVGGILPKDIEDGSFTRRAPTSNDKLLEQLIGKKKAKAHIAAQQQASRPGTQQQQKFSRSSGSTKKEESDDEDEGRSAAFQSKRRRLKKPPVTVRDKESDGNIPEGQTMNETPEPSSTTVPEPTKDMSEEEEARAPPKAIPRRAKPKPTSFLDEILAERSKKKRKKKDIHHD